MANQIHVVPHFHWDREWYFTTEESKILLVNDMEEILTMLEENPDYPYFVMDGQTAVLEDYLSVKPENRQRMKNLIDQGKLIIGPWYTQTDEMVVGGESIVRNLLYGKMDCEKFGPRMMIGYLPDSFGQSARLPQILNGFGINRCIFWRGTSERMGSSKTEFYWNGDDKSQVLVQLLPLGYAIGKYLPTDEDALKERLDKYLPVLDRGATTDHILLPNGHDQMPIQKNIFEIMKKIEQCYPGRKTVLSRYEDVFDIIEKGENLDTLQGEFLDGKYMRVHRSIYSSRADLKSANTRIENKITNILEPLASIAYRLGFEYHHGLIEAIWKELLKNHAHDSIGCCCSDKVHRAIADRFFLAEDRADNLIEFYKRKIVDSMSTDDTLDKFTVFNTLPYPRKEVVTGEIITKMKCFSLVDDNGCTIPFEVMKAEIVDAGLIDRQIVHYGNYDPFMKYTIALEDTIPAMGYKTYLVKENTGLLHAHSSDLVSDNILENSYYKIQIENNGTLTVCDKMTGEMYRQVLLVEDGSDDGDEYDFSPLQDDFILTSHHVEAAVNVTEYKYLSKADITFELQIPKDLESRKAKRTDGSLEITFHVELRKDSPLIRIIMDINNHAKDHRVRVMIPNQLAGKWSISDNQFGSIKRPVVDDAMDVWEKEKWSERPDSIFPFLSFVHLEQEKGLAVLTNSVREYEITGKDFDTIAVTIFRSVGVLGKENLYRRPGRPSGIKMETPDSQMLGSQSYSFAITSDCAHVSQRAKEYVTPLVTYNKMPYNAMKLNASSIHSPYSFSLVEIDNPSITVSVLKKEEMGEGLLLRCYNATKHVQEGILSTNCQYVGDVRLDETELHTRCDESGLVLEPNQNKTILLK
jgi:mannosylglycerate hydrolase